MPYRAPVASREWLLGLALALTACGSGGSAAAGADAGLSGDVTTGVLDGSGGDALTDESAAEASEGTDAPAGNLGDGGPCGTRTGHRGLTSRSMTVSGLNRTYLVYLPQALDPATPVPFVFVHHGLTMSGQEMYAITQYTALADAQGIGVAFPDGQSGPNSLEAPWNVGSGICPSSDGVAPASAAGDDFAFIEAMKGDVSQDQCLDLAHVFVTGFSMGGYFAHHAGCMMSDIRAVAPHSGGTHDLSACTNAREPILIFHGDSDPIVPDGCDDPAAPTPIGWTGGPSATAWAAHNGCATTTTTTAVTGGSCTYYDACPDGGQVAYCVFTGMGHCWAGGAEDGGIFSCPTYAAATELEWAFFKKYAW